ncbi:MAG TPA: chorismate-binding protein, partial [Actinotalea sp.]|nr:chorismate-binding protein [Actinotalea sp.]
MTPAVPDPLPWGATWPSLPEFRDLAAGRRVVPVVRRLLADEVTPVGLYRTLAHGRPGKFVLESAEADGTWARWSFVGVRSRATLTVVAGTPRWTGDVPAGVPTDGPVLDVIAGTLDTLRTPALPGLPPLTGGLVGTLGWPVIRHWEPTLPQAAPDEQGLPELVLCLASDLAAVDHRDGSVWLVANAINGDGSDERVDEAWQDAVARLDAMATTLATHVPTAPSVVVDDALPEPKLRSSQDEYEAAVRTGKEAIRDGEVFQVVLSQRMDVECPADPFDVYRVLRTLNPSPYMYYLHVLGADGEDVSVVGSSPETLVRVDHGRVLTYPIAGSRPRGTTPEADADLATDLLADPKERAEHVMSLIRQMRGGKA